MLGQQCAYGYDDDGWECVAELDGTGALVRSHVWALDTAASRRGAGGCGGLLWINSVANGRHMVAYDGIGNVLGLIGTSGLVTARYEYGPYGELLRVTGDPIAGENRGSGGKSGIIPGGPE